MAFLANFPMVSQLTSITGDGQPSNNKQYDCVAASIGACILWYEGKGQWDSAVNPDVLKDAAYSEKFVGGTSAAAYVSYCKSIGYNLVPVNGSPTQLVARVHDELKNGCPVIFTEPDPYVSSSLGWSHVCVFYAETSGGLTCLDPYIAKPITRSDAEWIALLEFNQVWLLTPTNGELTMLQLGSGMGAFYHDVSAPNQTRWHCDKTNVDLIAANLAFYRLHEGIGGLALTNEIYLSNMPGSAIVCFERYIQIYDPAHKYDGPPEAGEVYLMHIDSGVGQQIIAKPLLVNLQQQVTQLQQQLAQAQQNNNSAQVTALQNQVAAYQQACTNILSIIQAAGVK